jgi:hypothetical protein
LYGSHLAAFAKDGLVLEIADGTGEPMFTPPRPDLYICPLCLRVFYRAPLNELASPCPLTIEDVPPKSVTKGVPRTHVLTCQQCNNMLGSKAESELEAALAQRDLRPGHRDGRRKCTLRTSHAAVHARLQISEGGAYQFEVLRSASASGSQRLFADLRSESRLTVTLRAPRPARTDAALLKAAYLQAFASFGYGYILSSPVMHDIRTRIANSDAPSPIDSGVVRFASPPATLPSPSISVVTAPAALRSILVTLPLRRRGGDLRNVSVFLPGPSATDLALYAELSNRSSAVYDVEGVVVLSPAPGEQTPLRDPSARHVLAYQWRSLLEQCSNDGQAGAAPAHA